MKHKTWSNSSYALPYATIIILLCVAFECCHASDMIATDNHAELKEDQHSSSDPSSVNRHLDWTDTMTLVGLGLASLSVCIAAGGGVGGGGILVPVYIFVLGFPAKTAIPLSTITILGSSVVNCILNTKKRHPGADRPLIDWDIMLMMEPLTIAGTVLGSFINVLCPPWVLCLMLVLLLGATSVKTLRKGIKMYEKETKLKQSSIDSKSLLSDNLVANDEEGRSQRQRQKNTTTTEKKTYLRAISDVENRRSSPSSKAATTARHQSLREIFSPKSTASKTQENSPRSYDDGDGYGDGAYTEEERALTELYRKESTHSMPKVTVMIFLTVGVLLLAIAKGGHGVNIFNVVCGTWQYWLISALVMPFVLAISYVARRHLVRDFHLKQHLGYEYVEGDVQWDERNTIKYPSICSIAGLCAGLFGIGGGIVKGPLMLEMGVNPSVASATSATMILLTSSAAAVSYLLFNSLNVNYAPYLFSIGAFFTLIGQKVLNHVVKKSGRSSLIILVIGLTVAISTLAMTIQSSTAIVHLVEGHPDAPSSLCG